MQAIKQINTLDGILSKHRSPPEKIGLVPTMGALHMGHISLVRNSIAENDLTVVSIYVNPTQFNDRNDLRNYPRTLEKDLEMLNSAGCDIVFVPDNKEMYPEKDTRRFDFGTLGEVMEGKKRPGHFNGVAQIVTKLFNAVKPHRAYFGKKDFQQLAIIRKLVEDLHYSIEIIGCPIIRETDGLAMSSRNTLLSPEERKKAPEIYKTLVQVKKMMSSRNIPDLERFVEDAVNGTVHLKLDYFQIVNSKTLVPVKKITKAEPVTACIAAFAGKIRLIDNLDLIA
ncbi:MAG: pantoate--beta-alanine ligase [Bacteroidales bacterium]|jgi:pantoate--beta-alanine ligase